MSNPREEQQWAAVLRSSAWFASLPEELATGLASCAVVKRLTIGQRLFARYDAFDGIYCVLDGLIRIRGIGEDGQEAVLAIVGSPQWFGEIALFDSERRTHDAWAESEAQLLHVRQRDLMKILSEKPEYWKEFGRLLTQKLRAVFIAVENNFLMPATARLANRLASMAASYGAYADRRLRVIKVSQEQLGLMLGLSRQTVNASLNELEKGGALRRHRGAIEIIDPDTLHACYEKISSPSKKTRSSGR
jgi:CRP-like cAMP-binding protein